MNRYNGLAFAFVGLADTLVADFDVLELAQQLVESALVLHTVDAASVLLADADGNLRALASNSDQAYDLERSEVEHGAGPCALAYHSGEPVTVEDLRADGQRWPRYAARAVDHGFMSQHVLPMRLRSDRVGALSLLRCCPGSLTDADLAIGRSLADVATIGIQHQRIATQLNLSNYQLQMALDSRTVIEQAKGVLATRGKIDVNRAFTLLRAHARRTNARLADLAQAVVDGADTTAILNPD